MPNPPGSEQREGERAIAYWEDKVTRLGTNATVGALTPDLAAMQSDAWSHRFVVASDSVIEDATLMLYGANFAKLLGIPPERKPPLAMRHWVPNRFFQVFLDGCSDAFKLNTPVRVEGEVPRAHGQRELFRAAFMPIGKDSGTPVRLAFGAFNSRLADASISA